MSWKFDAPSGVYKNHALSDNIRRQSIADTMFMPFLSPEPGYGKSKGENVTITRVLSLPLATRVSEVDQLPSGKPSIQTKSQVVSEWGFKIPMTEFEKNLTHFDLNNQYQLALKDQMSLTMDQMAADALKTTPYLYIPVTTGGTFDTDGTASTTADRNLNVQDLRDVYDQLHGTLKCPKFRGGKYVGILSTTAARGIKDDPKYKDWLAPTTSMPFISGMLRDVEGFTLFETNHFDALSNGVGTGSVLGEAIFFGMDAGFLLSIEEPEIRAGLPTDLGRTQEVGWVGTIEAGLTWETAALSRAIYVTSA